MSLIKACDAVFCAGANYVGTFQYFAQQKAAFITAPFSGGQDKGGVDEGPSHILDKGIVDQVNGLGWSTRVEELEFPLVANDEPVGHLKRVRNVSEACQKISNAVSNSCANGELPVTIGGDHSIAIGTVSGVQKVYPDACLLWIDAHADINTPKSSPSGNIHGMPVSFLLGIAEGCPKQLEWVPKCLSPDRIAYIGLRDVDSGEKELLKKHNIAAFSMYHVDKYGISKVIEMALAKVNPNNDRPIHVSYDVDAIDPMFTPATGTPVRGGLSLREGLYIPEAIAETGKLVALDVVECNPILGSEDHHVLDTVSASCSIIRCALGETIV